MRTATIAAAALAVILLAVGTACGPAASSDVTPVTTDTVDTAVAGTPAASTPVPPATVTPVPGLTDTGYKAPDGTPLYKECIGDDILQRASPSVTVLPKLPLPPTYPASGTPEPVPSPPANPNPNPRPPAADLPSFDVLSVAPAETTGWVHYSTPCLGGFSFSVPPEWKVTTPFGVGGYQAASGAGFQSDLPYIKVDITYYYTRADEGGLFSNGAASGTMYFLARNHAATIGGRDGVMDIVSGDLRVKYVDVTYVVRPRPDWYLTVDAIFEVPYSPAAFADLFGMMATVKFAP